MKLLALVLLLAGSVGAQGLPEKPQPTVKVELIYPDEDYAHKWVTLPVPHRTADAAWLSMNSAAVGASAIDMSLALTHLSLEGNPLVRKAPIAAVGIAAGGTALALYFSYRWKREEDALRAAHVEHRGIRWYWADLAALGPHAVGIAISAATLAHK